MSKKLKRQREGAVIETDDTQDILMLKLSKALIKCCDELGNLGCDGCPVRTKCRCLWQRVENSVTHNLNLTEYRQLSQKFYMLRQERNQILESRGIAVLSKTMLKSA